MQKNIIIQSSEGKILRKFVFISFIAVILMAQLSFAEEVYTDLIQQELDRIESNTGVDETEKVEDTSLPSVGQASAEEILRISEFYKSEIDVLDVKNLDVNKVLDIISKKTGFHIVAEEYFASKITIYLTHIDVFDALRIILDSNGLAYYVRGGIVYVISADSFYDEFGYRFGQKLQTEIVPIEYGDSGEITSILKNMKSDIGNVMFNENTSSFILIDHRDEIQKMTDLIAQMDIPVETNTFALVNVDPEVAVKSVGDILTENIGRVHLNENKSMITVKDLPAKLAEVQELINSFEQQKKALVVKSKVIQITLNDEHLDGVDWSAILSGYKESQIEGFYAEQWGNTKDVISVGTILAEDYDILLEALDTVGLIRNIFEKAEDVVTAETAKVFIHSDDLLLSETSYIKTNKKRKNEQARFFIRPLLFGENMVSLDVAGIILDLDSPNGKEEDLVPIQLRMKIGNTLVIGGIYKEELTVGIKRIPIVGKIPFLGSAFKKHKHNMKKTEVIIFVTIEEGSIKKKDDVENSK